VEGAAAVDAADEAVFQNKLKRLEKEKERRKDLESFLLSSAETFAQGLVSLDKIRLENETTAALDALNIEFEARRANAQGNAAALEKIDAEYAKKKLALEKQAAQERRQIALKEAIIQGALAIVKALPNPFLAAAAGLAAAFQVAIISKQKFERGGMLSPKSGVFGGRPHSAGGTRLRGDDGTDVEVEADEVFVILNRRASAAIKKLSDFNHLHGGRKFGSGGVLDIAPQLAQPGASNGQETLVVVTEARFSDAQMEQFATMVADKTAAGSQAAIIGGLDEVNRTSERQKALSSNRQV
jgi:hypothetical protein